MNLVPQVETAEISDADLDNVSGGQAGAVGLAAGVAVTADGGAGLYAEAGPVGISAGLGGSVTLDGVSAAGQARTTMY
ncbi:hypothetical protein [Streptomyces griseomycini]|uniref:Type A2 lantipeptide n=1 Tax=Streptomyces griseomycini TaxID=66895 RepID=A0A7W7PPQ1_9ACTN|nr:hypothetical protein [Streptomyces griseomycini]MBB4897724.1 hypothetical protein [Streptomyces griseomycini]GGQ20358.1 hypothetical protein GCM10010266_49310 [Streptomyces griseomycini]GGR11806.1 hypothetical protein GCM10015536_16680 [Streptomyces griseomycini]